ncbi:type III secretion system chaperone [Leptothoe sp. PORK10 BA2]|uniref:type III secretion system chaperone n=1 Tax=Leptothoe sp. PORK10 BA2 TaxID=3110254 RepID=UPI002B20DEA0|nr:type III secretion system chaperone [Leptothoe sp. PORK10 BA2]MEA5462396.1 type III secretion system chaperone [Leptothoe sp. PORK10 BA2]
MTFFSRRASFAIAALIALSMPLVTTVACAQTAPIQSPEQLQPMTVERLEQILESEVSNVEGENGQWRFSVADRAVIVLADASNDRMRVFSPVLPVEELTAQQVQAMLAANFHTALDARYAITDAAVVAVYVHPLSTLQGDNFRSALRQVVSLAETFGSSYSSNELNFGLRQRQRPSDLEQI